MNQEAKISIAGASAGKKGVMLLNRIGPSRSVLCVANADGSDERLLFEGSEADYHASFSPDGEWITFTTERNGDGNADIYRCRADGSNVMPVVATPSVEDVLVMSPDGRSGAYVSTADGFKANIWVVDLASGARRNLTGRPEIAGRADSPDGYFRPSWSPDGAWLVFSSDRNTGWYGHRQGHGWEHTQELGIYAMRVDGTGFRQITARQGHALGTPKFSPDGSRVVFYEMEREHNWYSRRPEKIANGVSQIVSVDFATGGDRQVHTDGPGIKICPQYLPDGSIAYYLKGIGMDTNLRATDLAWMNYEGPKTGLYYTSGATPVHRALRSPCWSPDGTRVIYEKTSFAWRPQGKPLFGWDDDWDYRSTDVFPVLSRQGKLAITEKQNGNSSVVTCKPDGSDRRVVFDVNGKGLDPVQNKKGLAGAFQPTWSPDGEWIAFGLGPWFDARARATAKIMRVKADGSSWEDLTDGTEHAGFPSYSADGREVVYRVWSKDGGGLRIVNVDNKSVRVLTTGIDNMPSWSPDGEWITFTREYGWADYHICIIRPDGTDFRQLTTSRATDAHSVWLPDGRIAYSTAQYGFRDEAAIYDYTFQPYGQIMVMDADGRNQRLVTDSLWEDSMPCFIPREFLD
jgi:Tol biopolymer transport system component